MADLAGVTVGQRLEAAEAAVVAAAVVWRRARRAWLACNDSRSSRLLTEYAEAKVGLAAAVDYLGDLQQAVAP